MMPLRDEMLALRLLIHCHDLLPGSCEKLDGKGWWWGNLKWNSGKMAIPPVQKLSGFLLAPVILLDNKTRPMKEQFCYLGGCSELIVVIVVAGGGGGLLLNFSGALFWAPMWSRRAWKWSLFSPLHWVTVMLSRRGCFSRLVKSCN